MLGPTRGKCSAASRPCPHRISDYLTRFHDTKTSIPLALNMPCRSAPKRMHCARRQNARGDAGCRTFQDSCADRDCARTGSAKHHAAGDRNPGCIRSRFHSVPPNDQSDDRVTGERPRDVEDSGGPRFHLALSCRGTTAGGTFVRPVRVRVFDHWRGNAVSHSLLWSIPGSGDSNYGSV